MTLDGAAISDEMVAIANVPAAAIAVQGLLDGLRHDQAPAGDASAAVQAQPSALIVFGAAASGAYTAYKIYIWLWGMSQRLLNS